MSEVLARIVIFAAEKGAPHAAGDAVVVVCVLQADLLTSGNGHRDYIREFRCKTLSLEPLLTQRAITLSVAFR